MPIYRNLNKYIFKPNDPLRKIISHFYQKKLDVSLICDKNRQICGLMTLSDLKKAIVNGTDPNTLVHEVMNKEFLSAPHTHKESDLVSLSKKQNKNQTKVIDRIPLVNKRGVVKGLYVNQKLVDKFSQKTVLVTGGAGYVGSLLSRKLLTKGYKVIVIDMLQFGRESIKDFLNHKNFKLIEGSISDISVLMMGIREADAVIHLAGIVGDPASSVNPLSTLEYNHFSTKSLIELCKYYQIPRLVFASSCSVYGAGKNISDEKSIVNPLSLYARTKVSSENDLLKAVDEHFHPTILRFSTLYGLSPRMRFDLVVNTMTANAFYKKLITVSGGDQWRPLLHVSDAAESCIKALEAKIEKVSGQIFNVGSSGENYTIAGIAKKIHQLIPKSQIVIKDAEGDKRDYKVSFRKIQNVLGFKNSNKLELGIKEIVAEMKKGKFIKFKDKIYSNYEKQIWGSLHSSSR